MINVYISVRFRQWLYDNIYLSGHYPFDKILSIVEDILSDSKVTDEESAYLTSIINELLNPVDSLKTQINSVDGKHICLSGNFAYGQKSEVEKYINKCGGFVAENCGRIVNVLIWLLSACLFINNRVTACFHMFNIRNTVPAGLCRVRAAEIIVNSE